jgi:2-keto-3-deoxy-6-phosphogluconate aldolase
MFTANYNAYKALGRSDIYLKVSMASKPIGLLILLATMPFGVMTIACGMLIANFCSQLVCTFPNKKLLGYSYLEQIKDILPQLLLAVAMGIIVHSVQLLNLHPFITLILQIPLGVGTYVLGAKLFRLEIYQYVQNMAKNYINKRKNKEQI